MVTSTTAVPWASRTVRYTPLWAGSSAGENGTASATRPLKRSLSSPGGMLSAIVSLVTVVASGLVHGSHSPAEERQTMPAASSASGGHVGVVPSQVSATSQMPAAVRQIAPLGASTSAGQSFEVPSHVSATSHAPTAARQTAVLFASGGQGADVPVQRSAGSQTPADDRHT